MSDFDELGLSFDDSNTEPDTVPDGDYTYEIVKADVIKNENGWAALKLQCKIAEGEFTGRYVFPGTMTIMLEGKTLRDPDCSKAVKFGTGRVNQLRKACGIDKLTSYRQLEGQRVSGKTVTKDDDFRGEKVNDITKWSSLGGSGGFSGGPVTPGFGN
jgi:hypothetical protein